MSEFNMKVTPEIERLTEACKDHTTMDISLYGKYDVKRGLRDINGKGVLAGLTQVSNVQAVKVVDGKEDSLCRKSVLSRLQYQRPYGRFCKR